MSGRPLQTLSYEGIGVLALVACVTGILVHRPERPAYLWWLAAAICFHLAGDAVLFVYDLRATTAPFPSIADFVYLGGYASVVVSMILLVRRRERPVLSDVLDALIVLVGSALLFWFTLVEPFARGAGSNVLSKLVSAAYPSADVLLVVAVSQLVLSTGTRSTSFRLIAVGTLFLLATDVVYGLESLRGAVRAGRLAGRRLDDLAGAVRRGGAPPVDLIPRLEDAGARHAPDLAASRVARRRAADHAGRLRLLLGPRRLGRSHRHRRSGDIDDAARRRPAGAPLLRARGDRRGVAGRRRSHGDRCRAPQGERAIRERGTARSTARSTSGARRRGRPTGPRGSRRRSSIPSTARAWTAAGSWSQVHPDDRAEVAEVTARAQSSSGQVGSELSVPGR